MFGLRQPFFILRIRQSHFKMHPILDAWTADSYNNNMERTRTLKPLDTLMYPNKCITLKKKPVKCELKLVVKVARDNNERKNTLFAQVVPDFRTINNETNINKLGPGC